MEDVVKANKPVILVVSKHDYVVQSLSHIVKRNGYEPIMASQEDEVFKAIKNKTFDAILIGGGVDPAIRSKYTDMVRTMRPDVRIIEHYGGPATLPEELAAHFRI